MEVTQDKHTVTAKPSAPQHWSSAHGRIKGHQIPRMPFNTIVLSGEISADENEITWSNQVVWTRVVEKPDDPEPDEEPIDAEAAAGGDAGAVGGTQEGTSIADEDDTGPVAEPQAPPATDEGKAVDAPPPPPPSEMEKENTPKAVAKATEDTPTASPPAAGSSGTTGSEDTTTGKGSGGTTAAQLTKLSEELKKANAATKAAKADAQRAKEALAESTAKSDAKQKSGRKELMTCREQTLSLQTEIETKDQFIAVLYCAIGVLIVLLCFQSCRRMGSAADAADGDAAEETEWAQERHSKMRTQIAEGSTSTLAKAL